MRNKSTVTIMSREQILKKNEKEKEKEKKDMNARNIRNMCTEVSLMRLVG